MPSMIDYMKWRSDITFSQTEVNDIDCIIFSELCYLPFEGIVPSVADGKYILLSDAAHKFFDAYKNGITVGAIIPDEIIGLFKHASRTRRFSDVKMWGYENDVNLKEEKQFSAICFSLENGVTYVAFRGTDDSIIGWKENFNMAIYTPIPAQKSSLEYLNSVAKKIKGDIIVGGHSKGGNLAVYSSLNSSDLAKKKIRKIYSFDGPGFKDNFISIKDVDTVDKIINVLPESSIVGRIFDIVGDYQIVKSINNGIFQHDAFSWEVMACDFVEAPAYTKQSDEFHVLLKKWVSNMTKDEVVAIIESSYNLLVGSNADTLSEISSEKIRFIMSILKADPEDKKNIWNGIRRLISEKYTSEKKKSKKSAKGQMSKEKTQSEEEVYLIEKA